jgi:hypothetical protein
MLDPTKCPLKIVKNNSHFEFYSVPIIKKHFLFALPFTPLPD